MTDNLNASFPHAGADTARDLRRRARRLMELSGRLQDGEDLSVLDQDELLEMLRIGENTALGIRRALSGKRMLPDRERRPAGAPCAPAEHLPVKAEYGDGILTVSCPPKIGRAHV